MEFTNEISFDNKLIKNKNAKINYNGSLVRNGANSLFIVYGYGADWNETDSKEMHKSNIGFEVELKMKSYDTFNFCFRDENYNWDNNNYFNYISPLEDEIIEIEENTVPERTQENEIPQEQESKSIQEVEVKNIEAEIAQLFDELFGETQNNLQTTNSTSFDEVTEEKTINSQEFSLDALIEEILNPVIEEQASNENANIQEIEVINENENKFIDLFEPEVSELNVENAHTSTLVEDILIPYYEAQEPAISSKESEKLEDMDSLIETLVNNTKEAVDNAIYSASTQEDTKNYVTPSFIPEPEVEKENQVQEIENDINEDIEKNIQTIENDIDNEIKENQKISDFTVLEDEIDEPSLLEEVKQDKENSRVEESVALSVVEEFDDLTVSPRKLGKLYFVKKKIKLAFYKALIAIPKLFGKQFDSNND